MKTYELIAFVRQKVNPSRVMSKKDIEQFERRKLLLTHILTHSNYALYKENQEQITSFIDEQIDYTQRQMKVSKELEESNLTYLQAVQKHLIELQKGAEGDEY